MIRLASVQEYPDGPKTDIVLSVEELAYVFDTVLGPTTVEMLPSPQSIVAVPE
jgi:hypothetical protein